MIPIREHPADPSPCWTATLHHLARPCPASPAVPSDVPQHTYAPIAMTERMSEVAERLLADTARLTEVPVPDREVCRP